MRVRPLFPFILLIAGCGGSKAHDGGVRAIARITTQGAERLGAGVDLAGDPVLVGYDPAGTLRVVTTQGTTTIVATGGGTIVSPTVTGDFVLVPGGSDTNGTLVVDRRSGASRIDANEGAVAADGDRVVWQSDTGFVLEDLASGARTTLPFSREDQIRALTGPYLLIGEASGTTVDGSSVFTTYTNHVVALDGTSDVALPGSSYAEGIPRAFMNASGEVLSFDTTGHFLRWSVDGALTKPAPDLQGLPLGLAADGTAIVQRTSDGGIEALKGTDSRSTGLQLATAGEVTGSQDGRYVFQEEGATLAAYQIT